MLFGFEVSKETSELYLENRIMKTKDKSDRKERIIRGNWLIIVEQREKFNDTAKKRLNLRRDCTNSQANKSAGGMPGHQEPKKDATSCDKL